MALSHWNIYNFPKLRIEHWTSVTEYKPNIPKHNNRPNVYHNGNASDSPSFDAFAWDFLRWMRCFDYQLHQVQSWINYALNYS